MAGREYHEVRKRQNDEKDAAVYDRYARRLLGELKEFMSMAELEQLRWVKDLPGGVRITVSAHSKFYKDEIDIYVPPKEKPPPPKRLEIKTPHHKATAEGTFDKSDATVPPFQQRGKWVEKFIKGKILTGVLGVFGKPYPDTDQHVFLWRPGKGSIEISSGESSAGGLSADATVAAFTDQTQGKVARWTEGGIEYMSQYGSAANLSDNARFITGVLSAGGVFLWDHDTGDIIPMNMGGTTGGSHDVSNEGFVAGYTKGAASLEYRPALWAKDGSRIDLPYGSNLAGQAWAVSDNGEVVVGYVTYYDGSQNKAPAAMWRKKNSYALEILPFVAGYDTWAVMLFVPSTADVSADGSIVYISFVRVIDGARMVAKWTESVGLEVLSITGGTGPVVWGTTRFGDAVTGSFYLGNEHAFVWQDGKTIALPFPAGGDTSTGNFVATMEREISAGFHYEEIINPEQE